MCKNLKNWISHCNIYHHPHLSPKARTAITFQSYLNYIETKQDWWSLFGGSRLYLIFLLLTLYLYNKYLYHCNKGKYIRSNYGALTRWRYYACTTPLDSDYLGCTVHRLQTTITEGISGYITDVHISWGPSVVNT